MHYHNQISNLKKKKLSKKNFTINNTQLISNFTHPVLNNINFHKILNDKSCIYPCKAFIPYKIFMYNITLGRCIINYNQIAKQLNVKDGPPC